MPSGFTAAPETGGHRRTPILHILHTPAGCPELTTAWEEVAQTRNVRDERKQKRPWKSTKSDSEAEYHMSKKHARKTNQTRQRCARPIVLLGTEVTGEFWPQQSPTPWVGIPTDSAVNSCMSELPGKLPGWQCTPTLEHRDWQCTPTLEHRG